MIEQFQVDTTAVQAVHLSEDIARVIRTRRPPLVVLDGMGGCGKTTVANFIKVKLLSWGIRAEVVGLDDEKEMHAVKKGKCGLNEGKDRSRELVQDHMRDLSGAVHYPVYNFRTESQTARRTYLLPGRSTGVLIVEGLGSSKILSECPHNFTGPIVRVCFGAAEELRLKRKFIRSQRRQPHMDVGEIQERMKRHLRMTLGYEVDMFRDSQSNNLIKKN